MTEAEYQAAVADELQRRAALDHQLDALIEENRRNRDKEKPK